MPKDRFRLDLFREMHFSKYEKRLVLKPGELLLEQDKPNDCLYIILRGSLTGFVTDENGHRDEVFYSTKNMFVGVRSFFSHDLNSYADVMANEETELVYIDINELSLSEQQNLIADFVPVIINELYIRQLHAQKIRKERETALKKLIQSEKMATLGQMAAGLAHELNNAIGVMQNNSQWLSKVIEEYLDEKESEQVVNLFKMGVETGLELSSKEVRKMSRTYENKYHLNSKQAKHLAKLGLDPEQYFSGVSKEDVGRVAESYYRIWELGSSLHDILIASNHAMHVIRSVKELAVSNQERKPTNVNDTIQESLVLLKSILRQVEVNFSAGNLQTISANSGELVQIWLNIIKNGCESMLHAKVPDPRLEIVTSMEKDTIAIVITDHGPGIPRDLQRKIFQPNFTTKKDGLSFGLGLGLSVVQRLVDSYNGKINVKSTHGETSFSIKLPIKQQYGED